MDPEAAQAEAPFTRLLTKNTSTSQIYPQAHFGTARCHLHRRVYKRAAERLDIERISLGWISVG
ncbi:MAG: hypothetical protein ACSLFF_08020 [Solirubrobacterales bacterium]